MQLHVCTHYTYFRKIGKCIYIYLKQKLKADYQKTMFKELKKLTIRRKEFVSN